VFEGGITKLFQFPLQVKLTMLPGVLLETHPVASRNF
jgi:hypothetical protein